MGKKITDVAIKELSLVFADHKGQQWAPVNEDAQVLTVKGGPKDGLKVKGRPSFLAKLGDTLKGIFGPVAIEVDDNIDGDGDGADDYNEIVGLISTLYWDLSSAWGISDQEARAAAVTCAIDNFLEFLDKMRSMKAGKRHSSSDQSHIDAIAGAKDKLGKAIDAATKAHAAIDEHVSALMPAQDNGDVDDMDKDKAKAALVSFEPGKVREDGLSTNHERLLKLRDKAKSDSKDGDYGSDDDAGYADQGYQEDGKKRYPLKKNGKLNEKRVRAAWSYINVAKNADKYSSEDLGKVKDKIRAAAKELGIEIEEGKGAPTSGTGDKAVAEAIAAAVDAAKGEMTARFNSDMDKIKADSKSVFDSIKAEYEAKVAELATKLDDASSKATAAETLLKAMAKEATKPTAPAFVPTLNSDGSRTNPEDPDGTHAKAEAKQQLDNKVKSGTATIGDVIRIQRLVNS